MCYNNSRFAQAKRNVQHEKLKAKKFQNLKLCLKCQNEEIELDFQFKFKEKLRVER